MPNRSPLRILELFCGIGGCAAAVGERADVVAAVDINRVALSVYSRNFKHPVVVRTIETLAAQTFEDWDADLWWLSPPCQPYTVRGRQLDVHDVRAASLLAVLDRIAELRPVYVALENVAGFQGSRAHHRLRETLQSAGYEMREGIVCPTELGVPNRRPRFYLVASRRSLAGPALLPDRPRRTETGKNGERWLFRIGEILDASPQTELWLPPQFADKYRGAIHLVDPADPAAESHCFTSAYGDSYVRSGSYLATPYGVRRFSPSEILRLLGYPGTYTLPPEMSLRSAWRVVGNSLSLATVRYVLSAIPELVDGSFNAQPKAPAEGGKPAPSAGR
jgi:site-specific DNA-cytosine methylase